MNSPLLTSLRRYIQCNYPGGIPSTLIPILEAEKSFTPTEFKSSPTDLTAVKFRKVNFIVPQKPSIEEKELLKNIATKGMNISARDCAIHESLPQDFIESLARSNDAPYEVCISFYGSERNEMIIQSDKMFLKTSLLSTIGSDPLAKKLFWTELKKIVAFLESKTSLKNVI